MQVVQRDEQRGEQRGELPGASTSSSATSKPSAAASSLGRHALPQGGALAPVFRVVQGLNLNDEQKAAIDKAGLDLRASESPRAMGSTADLAAALKQMEAELAAGVKAGKIDTAALNAEQARIEGARRTHDANSKRRR